MRQLPRPGHRHNVSKPWGTFRRLGWINETHHLKQQDFTRFLNFWPHKTLLPRSPLAIVQAIPAKQVEQRRNLRGTWNILMKSSFCWPSKLCSSNIDSCRKRTEWRRWRAKLSMEIPWQSLDVPGPILRIKNYLHNFKVYQSRIHVIFDHILGEAPSPQPFSRKSSQLSSAGRKKP